MSLCIETSICCGGGTSCVVSALDQSLEMRQYGLAKCGQRRAGQAAVEQWAPQLSLEPLDGVGQRGLRDAATFGRQREILIAAKSQEISDVVHLHECAPWVRRRLFANAQIGCLLDFTAAGCPLSE